MPSPDEVAAAWAEWKAATKRLRTAIGSAPDTFDGVLRLETDEATAEEVDQLGWGRRLVRYFGLPKIQDLAFRIARNLMRRLIG